jgi:hypothetical protein
MSLPAGNQTPPLGSVPPTLYLVNLDIRTTMCNLLSPVVATDIQSADSEAYLSRTVGN